MFLRKYEDQGRFTKGGINDQALREDPFNYYNCIFINYFIVAIIFRLFRLVVEYIMIV